MNNQNKQINSFHGESKRNQANKNRNENKQKKKNIQILNMQEAYHAQIWIKQHTHLQFIRLLIHNDKGWSNVYNHWIWITLHLSCMSHECWIIISYDTRNFLICVRCIIIMAIYYMSKFNSSCWFLLPHA